ncbi:protein RUFY3-like isoform X2 [Clavelina lepadiformis]|uniref:protein RUFY3-like isoform X2 n=1 Tax=Clavelina lepadiformis TaxID=159417 RepID=UPI004043874A
MPVVRKISNSAGKHHPYLSPTEQEENSFQPNETRHRSCVFRSMCNIPEASKPEEFIPRSMSAIEEKGDGWKLSFCGVLPTTQQLSDFSPGKCTGSRSVRPHSILSDSSSRIDTSMPSFIPRSRSCQVTSSHSDAKVNQLSSSPIPVPMREPKKRKTSNRSSGGYFFDKYMKRFKAKYGSRNRTNSIGEDKVLSEAQSNKKTREMKQAMKLAIRSNRQDMVFDERREHALAPKKVKQDDEKNGLTEDDLYPLRFGMSDQWDTQLQLVPKNSMASPSDINLCEQLNEDQLASFSVFPSSPPTFWGDANSGEMDNVFAQPVSPVPSLTDGADASCRYSDTNSETLKAMETLYLCNFRVTVDGDWLCLKEICDDIVPPCALVASTLEDEAASNGVEEQIKNKDEMKVERRNLLGMTKLSIKGLIESSLSAGHTLDSDHEPLQQFFIILEYVLRHGLKAPKNFFIQNKYFWPPLESVEKLCPDAMEITNSVRSLPGIRTHLGRGRAWLRLAVMQKKLADYFKIFIENKLILGEWYDEGALVMNDEGVVLAGHLVGLNCIDANLCMKGDDLDNQVTVIDYSMYMKDSNRNIAFQPDESEEHEETSMQNLVNQKNYLEERNRHLETISSELQRKVEHYEINNQNLETELDALKIQLETIKSDKERLQSEKVDITASHQKTLQDREKDLDTERETLRQSRAGLDEMYTQIQKQLKHETRMRMDVEKELQLQLSLKQELELAMKLLEKDIYDKQDGLITLREQLDNVKAINLDIYNKLQAKTVVEEEKNRSIEKLQKETEALANLVSKLQKQVKREQDKVEENRFDLVWI